MAYDGKLPKRTGEAAGDWTAAEHGECGADRLGSASIGEVSIREADFLLGLGGGTCSPVLFFCTLRKYF